MNKNIIVGLDIGTTKVVAVVAEVKANGIGFEVIGMGHHVSRGLKRGMVVNIDATVESIQNALQEAELMSDSKIERVYTGIAGNHIRSFNSSGMVAIRDKEVKANDIERVIETAKAIDISAGHQMLYLAAQEYKVDSQEGVREPMGMSGIRLEARVHIVTGATSAVQNIVKCVRRCGLEVNDLVLQPLASSDAVLKDDEKESGVILIDIGGGTTDVVIFTEGAIRHTASIPVAGEQVTSDIAMALRVPIQEAEQIKQQYGVAKQSLVNPQQMIDIDATEERAGRSVSRQALAAVIEPRVEELLHMVREVVNQSGLDAVIPYVVITGGSALLPGMLEMVEDILGKQCRLGKPDYRGQLADVIDSPRYATVVGLLKEARRHADSEASQVSAPTRPPNELWVKIKEWFRANF